MIHIVFDKSSKGSLRFALDEEDHKIIVLPINFSVGPITNIHHTVGIERYFSWLKSTHDIIWGDYEKDQILYEQGLKHLSEIKNDEQVIIWTCNNANEQIGLRIIAYLLNDRAVKLAMINTHKAMREHTKHQEIKIDIRHTGECSPEELVHFLMNDVCPISKELRDYLEWQGKETLQSTHLARSWKDGEIIHELETKDDSFILECAEMIHQKTRDSESILVARLIGEVLGHAPQTLSDAWIEYRIRTLIKAGYFQREGSARLYSVKLL